MRYADTYQKKTETSSIPVVIATPVATSPGIMNEWFARGIGTVKVYGSHYSRIVRNEEISVYGREHCNKKILRDAQRQT